MSHEEGNDEIWEAFKKAFEKKKLNFDEEGAWEAYKNHILSETKTTKPDLLLDSLLFPRGVTQVSLLSQEQDSKILDLHHLTQEEAYQALRSFLEQAISCKIRKVFIITGKGARDGEERSKFTGTLKRLVPRWLKEKPFNEWVSSIEQAPPWQGGAGALLVFLKKR